LDVDSTIKAGAYIVMDTNSTLALFMIDGMPEPSRFFRIFGGLLAEVEKAAKTVNPRTAVYG
jgi:hypothetical protein